MSIARNRGRNRDRVFSITITIAITMCISAWYDMNMDIPAETLQRLLTHLDAYAPPDFDDLTADQVEKLQLYRIMANQIPQRVFWKDRESRYVWANRRFAEDCNVESPEQLIGLSDYDMPWTAEQIEAFRSDDRAVMESGEPKLNIIEHQTRSDGSFAWLNTNKLPLFDQDGAVIGIIGTYEDITERAQAEIALRQYGEMIDTLFTHLPVSVFWKDRQSKYLGCNDRFAADAGLVSPEDVVGKTDDDLPWTANQAKMFQRVDSEVMTTNKPRLNFVEQQRQANGKTAWLQVNKVPLHNRDSQVIGVLGTYQAITEQIEAREALRRSRLVALEERQRLARDLHDAVSQTLWTASLIADVLPSVWENDPDEGRSNLDKLRRLTNGALAEMRTLLLELRPAYLVETDIRELLARLAEATMSRKKLEITVEAESVQGLTADMKIGLYRIVQETLNNVARHSRATAATICLKQKDGLLQLAVTDNGRGFDVKNRASERMGLNIMQERAADIDATLHIASIEGEGTMITLTKQLDVEKESK